MKIKFITGAKKRIPRVHRTHKQAKEAYDRISGFYNLISGPFENKFRILALKKMNIKEGESVLEIGFGTGRSLIEIAKDIGEGGRAYGIDISLGMLNMARRRLKKKGLLRRVELCCGDALYMPYKDNVFDVIFMSFTLELFDTPEIPEVLHEVKRVLKPEGRLGVVSMSRENGESLFLRLYEWAHRK